MIIKDELQSNILDFYVHKYSSQDRVCKDKYILNTNVNSFIDTLFKFNTIPSIERLSEIKAVNFYETYEKIDFIINSIHKCADKLKVAYEDEVNKYKYAYNRFESIFNKIQSRAYELLEYNCIYVPTNKSNQTSNSTCATIGKFAILPFFKKAASLYNGTASITGSSDSEIIFSNISDITTIPLDKFISAKITSANDTFVFTIYVSIQEAEMVNMVYLKLSNDVNNITLKLKNDTSILKQLNYNSNEVLANFSPITITGLEIIITCNNLNKGKPSAVQIENIHIFSNTIFQKNGVFETCSINLTDIANQSDSLMLYCNNYGDKDNTNTQELLSISANDDSPAFNKIKDDYIDISMYKYGHIDNIYTPCASGLTNSIVSTIHNKKYLINSYNNSNIKWDANIEKAKVLYGLNRYYIETAGEITSSKRFESWTLVGNYYVTYLLNYEQDVYLNIGSMTCILNNKEVTGIITIPVGISKVQVHVKDINFHSDSNTFILNKTNVLNDDLYPYNFLWLFAGLPEYNQSGGVEKVIRGPYSKSECVNITLRESFIPFTEEVRDDTDRVYTLQLTKTTDTEGTYTIEPYNGNIKVVPYSSANYVTVTYNKSQYNFKPCGILFKRLLTFAPFETIVTTDNTELFSLDGDSTSRSIILPSVQSDAEHQISSSQLIFNKENESMYVSTRIELETTNKYLTPIVGDIYLQTR